MYLSWTEHSATVQQPHALGLVVCVFFSYHQVTIRKLNSRWLRLKVIVSSSEGAILVSIAIFPS